MPALAFILSRPRDYPMALLCHRHLALMGWHPSVLIDPAEWIEPQPGALAAPYAPERRMVGNACHEAILNALVAHSAPGDILLKTDCDTRLDPALSDWLMARSSHAGTVLLGSQLWGGLWAAPRAQVAAVAAVAPTIPRCRCAESHLAICGLRKHGGITAYPDGQAMVWHHGTPWPDSAAVLTLPRTCTTMSRADYGTALFS